MVIAADWSYERLKSLVGDERMPCMIVDLDIFDENVRRLSRIAESR